MEVSMQLLQIFALPSTQLHVGEAQLALSVCSIEDEQTNK